MIETSKEQKLRPRHSPPQDWADEVPLKFIVSPVTDDGEYSEQWYEEMEAHAHEVDSEDIERLMKALADSKREQKELMRRQAGLPE